MHVDSNHRLAIDPDFPSVCDVTILCLLPFADREEPQLECPKDIVTVTTEDNVEVVWPVPRITDNVGLRVENGIRYSRQNGTKFESSTAGRYHLIFLQATDSFGNLNSCTFTIRVFKASTYLCLFCFAVWTLLLELFCFYILSFVTILVFLL